MSEMTIGYSDYRRGVPLTEGMVIATLPAGTPFPKDWYRCMKSVQCGGYVTPWSKSVEGVGCGVEIAYLCDASPPTVCAICGSMAMRSYNVFGLMGFGDEPTEDYTRYAFPRPIFGTERDVLKTLAARRKKLRGEGQDELVANVSAAMRGLLLLWKTAGLNPRRTS